MAPPAFVVPPVLPGGRGVRLSRTVRTPLPLLRQRRASVLATAAAASPIASAAAGGSSSGGATPSVGGPDAAALASRVAARVAAEADGGVAAGLGGLGATARGAALAALVALTAGLGWTGGSKMSREAGAGAAAVVGLTTAVGASRVVSKSSKGAAREIVACLNGGNAIDSGIAATYGVDAADFRVMLRRVYEIYLFEMVSSSPADASGGMVANQQMEELLRIKRALGLTGAEVGEAHYELGRIAKFFGVSESDLAARVERISKPLFRHVVSRATIDGSLQRADLAAAQASLGVSDSSARAIGLQAYTSRVHALVTEKGKLDAADVESLARLRTLLALGDSEGETVLIERAQPVFRAEVETVVAGVTDGSLSVSSAVGRMAVRQSELALPSDVCRSALTAVVRQSAVSLVKRASQYLRVQNVGGTVDQVKALLAYADTVLPLLTAARETFGSASAATDDATSAAATLRVYMGNLANAVGRQEPRQLYRLFLSDCLADVKIDEEEAESLARLRAVLSISDAEAADAYKSAAGPVYRKATKEAVEKNDLSEESRARKDKLKADLALPEETWKPMDVELYEARLRNLMNGNRVLQEGEAASLAQLRAYLGLSEAEVAKVTRSAVAPVYLQSVEEAMGPTGVMLPEYEAGLRRLRERLGLTEEDAESIFYKVVKSRMRVYVEKALLAMEKSKNLRGSSEERDIGDDPFIKRAGATLGIDAGGLTVELAALVNFYTRNKLTKTVEVDVPVPAKDGAEATTEKKSVTTYPVNLRGDFDPKVMNEMYKQYLVQCFSAQTRGEKQRLFAVLDELSGVLGLTTPEVNAIHSEIGSVIYKNYANQTLAKNGAKGLEEKDVEFLANIQQTLAMTDAQCKTIIKETKLNRISVMLEALFNRPKVLAESVAKLRATAKGLGVDLVRDLKVAKDQRSRLFSVEVDAAIERGAVTTETQDLIPQVKAELAIDDETARDVLLKCIQRRCSSHLIQAAASLRQERADTSVAELSTALRFGKLLPSEVKTGVISAAEKSELFLLYQAHLISGGALSDDARASLDLLKTMLGFTDADMAGIDA
ncbi:hypothetical protein I4F81_003420 [Pyropia yezoensis]|uniref:Uncharacterized protein n=1 Tax=Pyropia yezoensis TaxID=2788 RepID=A0ACC3BTA4_PYRYE|nr:hypothetical protein I4F81_003420 [Neopyropia yezoensis]